jgi:carbon-monoxide dehydrogenase medium subunit
MLAELGDDAKLLAGGQSLIPILNMRLAAPAHLIDLGALDSEPAEPLPAGDGALAFGPLVRHRAVERSPLVARELPVLAQTLAHVAHPAVRSRGTLVGSVAHADPAAELPAAMALLEGEAAVRGARGRRSVRASELFAGALETSLAADEWIEEVRLPVQGERGGAIEEFARRHGDYALCGVLALATPDGGADARVRVALAFVGMGVVPLRLELPPLTRDELAGAPLADAVRTLAAERLEPDDDIHATARYRLHLAERLSVRVARRAVADLDARSVSR